MLRSRKHSRSGSITTDSIFRADGTSGSRHHFRSSCCSRVQCSVSISPFAEGHTNVDREREPAPFAEHDVVDVRTAGRLALAFSVRLFGLGVVALVALRHRIGRTIGTPTPVVTTEPAGALRLLGLSHAAAPIDGIRASEDLVEVPLDVGIRAFLEG